MAARAAGASARSVGTTDGAAVGGSKFPAAASKVAGAPMGSCRFVSMDATAKPSLAGGEMLLRLA